MAVPTFTSFSNVDQILVELLTGVQKVLGEHLVGMYLYGSLAAGDFNPVTSDIDFLVITDALLSADLIEKLKVLHQQLRSSGEYWAQKLEGCYAPIREIRRYPEGASPCPNVNEERFYLAKPGSDWIIQRYILRKSAVRLFGPEPAELIDPVNSQDIRRAVCDVLDDWWAPMLENPERLLTREYQTYAMLTMCRALYALKYGEIISKPAAAHWAFEVLPPQWAGVIKEALAWPDGHQPDRLDMAVAMIRYTISLASEYRLTSSLSDRPIYFP